VRDPALAASARNEFESDLARSERVDLAAWQNRSPLDKMREFLSYWLIARADIFLSRIELFRTRW
jgi:phosphatidylserine/phosphatidylglycerophosphate/cardiolipin synthase-like enzyme